MPTVEFEFDELVRLIGRDYSPEELKESIPMIGVDLKEVGERVVVEVFPNRPDMLSVEGFARAMRGFLEIETGFRDYGVSPSGFSLSVDKSVSGVRPCISACVITGVEITEESLLSLMDLQEKLHTTHCRNRKKVAIGVHDMDKINGPFVYTAVKPEDIGFVPLDMKEKMTLKQILASHPKGRDFAHILEGAKKYPVILDAEGGMVSFPPIINAEKTRVTENSTNLFIEVTGTQQLPVDQALNIVAASIAERSGSIESVEILER
ncbi:MAG: phenylalanine--tRNA ligase subunit beta [Candidatus Altiarchaeales archaeon IMC4]|nr:MAG: phenylalanine--tRNA ligase subunit beta [Candidatus Altiarchaeales archaeon IMC4]